MGGMATPPTGHATMATPLCDWPHASPEWDWATGGCEEWPLLAVWEVFATRRSWPSAKSIGAAVCEVSAAATSEARPSAKSIAELEGGD